MKYVRPSFPCNLYLIPLSFCPMSMTYGTARVIALPGTFYVKKDISPQALMSRVTSITFDLQLHPYSHRSSTYLHLRAMDDRGKAHNPPLIIETQPSNTLQWPSGSDVLQTELMLLLKTRNMNSRDGSRIAISSSQRTTGPFECRGGLGACMILANSV